MKGILEILKNNNNNDISHPRSVMAGRILTVLGALPGCHRRHFINRHASPTK